MALPPTIPTSFVPKQPVKTAARPQRSGLNIFGVIALVIFFFAVLAAGAVFGYQKYLESVRDSAAAQLQAAKDSVDQSAIQDFVRTRDRFAGAKSLLAGHVAFSQFLDQLEKITLQTVRYSSLHFTGASGGEPAQIQMSGIAKSFNALAGESAAFDAVPALRHAIFSGITVDAKDGTVSFTLVADVDPSLITAALPSLPADQTAPAASAPVQGSSTSAASQPASTTSAAPAAPASSAPANAPAETAPPETAPVETAP